MENITTNEKKVFDQISSGIKSDKENGTTNNTGINIRENLEMLNAKINLDTSLEDSMSASSFVQVNRQDSDAAYERIKILKRTVSTLRQEINSTDCAGMDIDLIDIYDEIERLFKSAIYLESLAVENGEHFGY